MRARRRRGREGVGGGRVRATAGAKGGRRARFPAHASPRGQTEKRTPRSGRLSLWGLRCGGLAPGTAPPAPATPGSSPLGGLRTGCLGARRGAGTHKGQRLRCARRAAAPRRDARGRGPALARGGAPASLASRHQTADGRQNSKSAGKGGPTAGHGLCARRKSRPWTGRPRRSAPALAAHAGCGPAWCDARPSLCSHPCPARTGGGSWGGNTGETGSRDWGGKGGEARGGQHN